ncbi:hypothetical protein PIB30_027461 [Stylosanthes scabra]|uniref:RNase H type-1 domain-containing protein n=1 Tax=Stylosanthes scabra TaxID=79078 RepID=A0ABU6Z8C1_9FABA|nr:hypothetical protein [Stylosanthes scabra]
MALQGVEVSFELKRGNGSEGIRRLIVETDSVEVFEEIRKPTETSNFNPLIRDIMRMKDRPWEIEVSHTLREGNICADWLARASLKNLISAYSNRIVDPAS